MARTDADLRAEKGLGVRVLIAKVDLALSGAKVPGSEGARTNRKSGRSCVRCRQETHSGR